MKKSIKLAVVASVLTAPAMAANLENPLYIPQTGEFYSKTGAGVMYKKTDHSASLVAKGWDGQEEFPVWRLSEDAGYGITDRLSVNAKLGYTNDEDIQRRGLHNGRIGLLYRVFDGVSSPFVWDIYGDLHLGGLSQMEATLIPVDGPSLEFNYANYTNGRWGFFAGTRVGKTWDKFTGSVFGEIHQTFGDNNNVITISNGAKTLIGGMVAQQLKAANPALPDATVNALGAAYADGLPADFNVNLKSTTEYMTGINGFYQFNEDWSLGGGFSMRHRATNTIEQVNLTNSSTVPSAAQVAAITAGLADGFVGSMYDGIDEYVLSLAVSHKLTNTVQVSLYGEYTFDDSGKGSQNGTDVKAEGGVRVNVAF